MNPLLKVAPVALAAVVAACASPSPAPVLLTLPPAIAPINAAAPAAPASTPLLAVRRVSIPEYLVARRVRYRADAATLAEWPNTYWAERIEIGVSREFVSALHQQLPGWTMCDTNCGDQVPGLNLQVTLVPMDFLRVAQKLQARARITISGPGVPAKVLDTKELSVDIPASADTAQAYAQTISTLIEKVAAETAPMIRNARP
ncbi:MAG: ABC-type transport auxiliary lipoprotein family protein [Burkholderiales bacterium]